MTPHQKKTIEDFYHLMTIATVLGDKHLSKSKRKEKMMTLYAIAISPHLRDEIPGKWIMQIDRNFRQGKEDGHYEITRV